MGTRARGLAGLVDLLVSGSIDVSSRSDKSDCNLRTSPSTETPNNSGKEAVELREKSHTKIGIPNTIDTVSRFTKQ